MWTPLSHFASAVVVSLSLTLAALAQQDQQACAHPALAATGQQAFETFCSRCHLPETLVSHFDPPADPVKSEVELAAFLDGHGPCPHDRHDAIAAYLRQVAGR